MAGSREARAAPRTARENKNSARGPINNPRFSADVPCLLKNYIVKCKTKKKTSTTRRRAEAAAEDGGRGVGGERRKKNKVLKNTRERSDHRVTENERVRTRHTGAHEKLNDEPTRRCFSGTTVQHRYCCCCCFNPAGK